MTLAPLPGPHRKLNHPARTPARHTLRHTGPHQHRHQSTEDRTGYILRRNPPTRTIEIHTRNRTDHLTRKLGNILRRETDPSPVPQPKRLRVTSQPTLTIPLRHSGHLPHRPPDDHGPQPIRLHNLQQHRPHHHQLAHRRHQLTHNLIPTGPETPIHQTRDPRPTNPTRHRRHHSSIHRRTQRRIPTTRHPAHRLQHSRQPHRRRHIHINPSPRHSRSPRILLQGFLPQITGTIGAGRESTSPDALPPRPGDAPPPPGRPRATGPVAARHMLQSPRHRPHHAGLHPARHQASQAPPATSTHTRAPHHPAPRPQRQPLRHRNNINSHHHELLLVDSSPES